MYTESIKKGIIDYILKDPVEQERLGVPMATKPSNSAGREWYPWSDAVDDARDFMENYLYITHPIMTTILYKWETQ